MTKTMCELFAGVGGFRVGMEALNSGWDTVWFSQWEPGKKRQDAHDCYVSHFGDSPDTDGNFTTGIDINKVNKDKIPDHTLLVGGFPCQDYSVAHPLNSAEGIEGKKGVLWWDIRDTLIAKKSPFCIFENVDRLLKSPAKQRGRDFGIILACLTDLGYDAEWRVINGATYGAGQRRRRIFIFAYRNTTKYYDTVEELPNIDIINKKGFFARAFPIEKIEKLSSVEISTDIVKISDSFKFEFSNAGLLKDGVIYTTQVKEIEEEPIKLGALLQSNVDEKYYITPEKMEKWQYLKGAKKIERTAKNGHKYTFSEGPVGFPDALDKPARTMLTSESTLNRSSHAVKDPETGRIRIITPVEAERIQGFPDGWTDTGMSERFRYFCMGNALIVPMITRMGKILDEIIDEE